LAVSGGWPAAKQLSCAEDQMLVFFLLLVIAAMALGILGIVVKGLTSRLAAQISTVRPRVDPGHHPCRAMRNRAWRN
jgi:hypothetical protein